jgi:DNA-binding NarL/FixJ family response regulator
VRGAPPSGGGGAEWPSGVRNPNDDPTTNLQPRPASVTPAFTVNSSDSADGAEVDSDPSVSQQISVVIADDQQLVRAGFKLIIDGEPGMAVIGEASDGLGALDLARKRAPDVVLLDIRMPGMDGLEASRRIIEETECRVLLLTTFDADEYVFEGLRAGASGFLLKDVPPEQLCWAIRSIAAGNALIDPAVTRRLILRFTAAARATGGTPDQLQELTTRELDVLRLIARGRSNAEIAAELVVEESTVKSHVGRILMKLELRDRVQAVVLAYECGFVTPDLLGR